MRAGWQSVWALCLGGLGLMVAAVPARADTSGDTPPSHHLPLARGEADARPAPRLVRVLAWRSHGVCPMNGQQRVLHTVASVQEWSKTLTQGETGALGRRVRWSDERVLVFALGQQPSLAIKLESPNNLRLSGDVLWWPVTIRTPETGQMASTALGRPCVIAAVSRNGWQRVRVIERKPAAQ